MNYSGKIRILLDTTYILPIVGIDVEDIEKIIVLLKSSAIRELNSTIHNLIY